MLEKIPKCKKCGISEARISGYCSSRCEELAEYDEKISDLQSKLDTAIRSRDGWEQDALLRAKNLDNLKQSVKDAIEET